MCVAKILLNSTTSFFQIIKEEYETSKKYHALISSEN